MIASVKEKRGALEALCREYGVRRLELFGSATTGRFDSEFGDLDFLVEFPSGRSLGPWASDLTSLRKDLANLFGRPVDVVMTSALKDPYFKREAEKTRVTLFHASKVAEVAE